MEESDLLVFDSINAAPDRSEVKVMSGNLMTGLVISSATVGKKVVYTYDASGGQTSCTLENI